MCIPFTHKWKTIEVSETEVYSEHSDGTDLPINVYIVIQQRCKKCGKEVVRKYRTL